MLKRLIKFGITGGLGTITNLLLFFVLVDKLKLNYNVGNIICFIIACTQNYIINHIWTFRKEKREEKLSFVLWTKFLIASLVGLAVNMIVLNILINFFEWKYLVIPQGLGILAGMGLNFVFSNFYVFK